MDIMGTDTDRTGNADNNRAGVMEKNKVTVFNNAADNVYNIRATARVIPALGNIIGAFKSVVANECLKIFKSNNKHVGKIWQCNYYEHIIRNEKELNNIGQYITDNPAKWAEDNNNPGNLKAIP
ncbi:MAG: hypothetical protein JXN64_04780 [Spirochaetes bacterium]|nr:hypothetical protein [Spirochaetota bacterium]